MSKLGDNPLVVRVHGQVHQPLQESNLVLDILLGDTMASVGIVCIQKHLLGNLVCAGDIHVLYPFVLPVQPCALQP